MERELNFLILITRQTYFYEWDGTLIVFASAAALDCICCSCCSMIASRNIFLPDCVYGLILLLLHKTQLLFTQYKYKVESQLQFRLNVCVFRDCISSRTSFVPFAMVYTFVSHCMGSSKVLQACLYYINLSLSR